MKYLILGLLYTVCSPLVLADNPVLGDLVDIPNLSPDAHFCEVGKVKNNRLVDIERCKKGDLLYFSSKLVSESAAALVRVCEYGSMAQSAKETVAFKGFVGFTVCIYRGYEMPVRE